MDGAEIDRWSGRYRLAAAGMCVAQATFLTAPTTAAQNELEESVATQLDVRGRPVPGRYHHAGATLEF